MCLQTKPLCSLVARPAHAAAAAAAAARRIGITQRAPATATCSITTQATGIDPGIIPGTFPPTTPGGGVDPGPVPGIDPAPGPAPPDMPPGIDPRTNPGAPAGPSIIPGRGNPGGIDSPPLPDPVPGIDPAPGINPGDLGRIDNRMMGGVRMMSSNAGDGVSSTPEVDPAAGIHKPEASGPPSGQPSAQPEASGLPSGQPGDVANQEAAEPLVGKDRTAGPEAMGEAGDKKPEVGEAANPDRVPFWGS